MNNDLFPKSYMSSMSLEKQQSQKKKTKNVTLDLIIFSLAPNVHSNFTIFYNSSNKNILVLLKIITRKLKLVLFSKVPLKVLNIHPHN